MVQEQQTAQHGGDRRSGSFKRDNVTLETCAHARGNGGTYAYRRIQKLARGEAAELLDRPATWQAGS